MYTFSRHIKTKNNTTSRVCNQIDDHVWAQNRNQIMCKYKRFMLMLHDKSVKSLVIMHLKQQPQIESLAFISQTELRIHLV